MSKEYLKNFRKKYNLSQEELAVIVAAKVRTVQSWEQGTRNVPESAIKLIEQYQESKKEVIPLGKHAISRAAANAYAEWEGLPMYDSPITASFVETYRDEAVIQPQWFLLNPAFRDCDFGARITGDSMHDEIRHGDYAICKRIMDSRFLVFGEIYYIVAKNGLETCKYINSGKDDDTLLLVPKNQRIDPSPIPKEMIDKIYEVRGIVRGY